MFSVSISAFSSREYALSWSTSVASSCRGSGPAGEAGWAVRDLNESRRTCPPCSTAIGARTRRIEESQLIGSIRKRFACAHFVPRPLDHNRGMEPPKKRVNMGGDGLWPPWANVLTCMGLPQAGMAELADAADSKSADLRVLGVRL